MEPTLSKYDRIVKLINNLKLNALIAAGVDNCEYYDGAMNIYNGWKEEEE